MVQVKQHYLGCLAQASYVIISEGKGFIIDPRRDVEIYMRESEELEYEINGVMLTHIHADFVAGHQALSKYTKAPIYIGKQGNAAYDHIAVEDGMTLEFGKARLEFLETPGHTPGDVSIVLYDLSESATKPKAVFTGDTLFNGGSRF